MCQPLSVNSMLLGITYGNSVQLQLVFLPHSLLLKYLRYKVRRLGMSTLQLEQWLLPGVKITMLTFKQLFLVIGNTL